MSFYRPTYLRTYQNGQLQGKIDLAAKVLQDCTLCPRQCHVNRLAGQTGVCNTAQYAWVSSYGPHFGEEAPLVGRNGSGTIFFTHCNLLCNFCQNFDISHQGLGAEVTAAQLAEIMLSLQQRGCHNLNFVTPSHVVPQILAALQIAIEQGLCVPLIYNTGAYDQVETLKILDGVFDIYMPDFKFWDPEVAKHACNAPDYPEVARRAIQEMHHQVGDLVIGASGIAERGLLIRHLVMPGGLAGSPDIMRWLAQSVSTNTYVNIMFQYRPCGDAFEISELAQRPSEKDFSMAVQAAKEAGITRLDNPQRRLFF